MSDRDLQAPWIGLCREDYEDSLHGDREPIGYCEECGKELYEHDEFYEVDGGYVCEDCGAMREEE